VYCAVESLILGYGNFIDYMFSQLKLKGQEICMVSTLTVLFKSPSFAAVKVKFRIFSILRYRERKFHWKREIELGWFEEGLVHKMSSLDVRAIFCFVQNMRISQGKSLPSM
jgi:hypothetical protein